MSCSHSSIADSFVRAHAANVVVMPKQTQAWMRILASRIQAITDFGAWDPRLEL